MSIATAVIGLVIVLHETSNLQRLRNQGIILEATVITREERVSKGYKNYLLSYRYRLSGQEISAFASVNWPEYAAHPAGSQVQVTALPEVPAFHRYGAIDADYVRNYLLNGCIFASFTAIGIGLAGLVLRRRARRDQRFLRDWPAVSAQIIAIDQTQLANSRTQYNLRYRWPAENGGFHEGECSIFALQRLALRPSDFITVLNNPKFTEEAVPLFAIKRAEIKDD